MIDNLYVLLINQGIFTQKKKIRPKIREYNILKAKLISDVIILNIYDCPKILKNAKLQEYSIIFFKIIWTLGGGLSHPHSPEAASGLRWRYTFFTRFNENRFFDPQRRPEWLLQFRQPNAMIFWYVVRLIPIWRIPKLIKRIIDPSMGSWVQKSCGFSANLRANEQWMHSEFETIYLDFFVGFDRKKKIL